MCKVMVGAGLVGTREGIPRYWLFALPSSKADGFVAGRLSS